MITKTFRRQVSEKIDRKLYTVSHQGWIHRSSDQMQIGHINNQMGYVETCDSVLADHIDGLGFNVRLGLSIKE